jgi:hypothetical protein
MSDKYTQDLEILPGMPPQIAIFKNGLPMSYDDIEEDLEQLQAENEKQLEAINDLMRQLEISRKECERYKKAYLKDKT